MSDCTCKACAKARLNPDVSDVALAQVERHRRNGTSPGNPKWYHVPTVRPFTFEAGKAPVLPRIESGQQWHTWHGLNMKDPFEVAAKHETTRAYVRAHDKARGLLHVA